ncbi:TIGR01666 family membrane protein [Psychromonas sp. psych-6C06]|uniref:YccS family putative transporter n=1 Tax=Psychromonas sp. psych-6C06 TaxID=2058089 RepID=UPI000C34B9A4|nr:YccS family putative transporter [Psychromonas sp. psych-6C06]PKF63708.1 TIGR01666 family membrane protein [Psychromonas sp. psych-6C06]
MNNAISPMLRRLVSDSNIHVGVRVFIAMIITFFIPIANIAPTLFTQPSLNLSISLCLGVMASAIVENDDNHIGRRKFLFAILACFFVASSSVELLMPYPIFFALGLLISSFAFIMIATLGAHYSKVGFGAILIAIYTMVGHQPEAMWYEQPLLLTFGALWYGLFSMVWNFYNPHRSLREQLAQLFFTLSRYQQQKSALFNEVEGYNQQALYAIRQQLAIHNISIMARLQQSQNIIQSRMQIRQKQDELKSLNQLYIIAEQIHERISASQYLYSQLENSFGKSQILEGYHLLLLELSENCYQLGSAINDKKVYQHTRRLSWTIKALADQLALLKQKMQLVGDNHEAMLALQAIYDNIKGIDTLLKTVNSNNELAVISLNQEQELTKLPFWKRILNALSPHNNTFKHAVRISVSLALAFVVQQSFQLEHGFWLLLTVLFVCQPSFSETRKRLIQRILGTLLGLVIGYPILLLVDNIALQVFFMIASAFFFFNYLRTNYALAVIFITLFVMFVFNLLTGTGIEILPARIIETLFGGILSVLAITFIFPDWQFQRFPLLVRELLTLSNRYFNLVSNQYQYGRSENLHYRITRFQTFLADATLASAWQSMLFEPTSKQQLNREVYALVNRCDALVSYIAALASHRHKIEGFEHNIALQGLMNATARQISLAYDPQGIDQAQLMITIEEFENYKPTLSGEALLIVEQLRLIAFTALDIQVLLQKVNFPNTDR